MRQINPVGLSFALVTLLVTGCTQPGETTTIGATTGGVLGAGMGAIVGSQTGDALGGAAIGALAGAAAGGAVGNALQAHEEVMQRQDEAIERQQRIISSQQSEIQELRRIGQDTITFRDTSSEPSFRAPEERAAIQRTIVAPKVSQKQETQTSVWKQRSIQNTKTTSVPVTNTVASVSPAQSGDCGKADAEIKKGELQEDVSDKLFHYRRALRLCPGNSGYHNKIGELYLSLNRKEDAKYEFEEALRLSPANTTASSNLKKVNH